MSSPESPPPHPSQFMSPTSKAAAALAPASPYYNALCSAYTARKTGTTQLVPIVVGKKSPKTKEFISESKRHRREARARKDVEKNRQWWNHSAPLSGTNCTGHQLFLADDVDNFTGIYKKRFCEPKGGTAIAGDYHSTPRKCAKLLMNRTYSELNIDKRSADFRNEVTWRMRLRTEELSAYQMEQYRRARGAQRAREERDANRRESVRHEVVDSVGHLLHYFLEPGAVSKADQEEQEKIYMEARAREEAKERQRVMLTMEMKRRANFLLGPISNHDVEY